MNDADAAFVLAYKIGLQFPATRFGIVNEYRQTTAPVDIRLQGAQGGGATIFCGPRAGVVSKILAEAAASSRIFSVNCETPRH